MGLVSYLYKKKFVCRYDKEVGVPYYSYQDFVNLRQDSFSFKNSKGDDIHYFFYYYDNYRVDKVILFCHGLGPGHVAYLREIECLAKRGYKVLTLDYTGCGESSGKNMRSLNQPTRDVMELLNLLKLKEEIVLMGHSLGGYTALNIINLRNDIKKAVILSGFLSMPLLLPTFIKSKSIVDKVLKYEKKIDPEYYALDNLVYSSTTNDKIFFIQSEDDQMVPYINALKVVEEIENPCIRKLRMNHRKHNPNYTDDAVKYMNGVFGKYYQLIKNKQIKTNQDKIDYFKDKSLERMTNQDQELFDQIQAFFEQ